MTTLSKALKDTNGNTVIPKTRSEQVYRPNNTTVETSISNMQTDIDNTKMNLDTLTTKVHSIPEINSEMVVYTFIHTKNGNSHILMCNQWVREGASTVNHGSFKATGDYVAGDSVVLNNTMYKFQTITHEDLPDGYFKTGAVVSFDFDPNMTTCFFRSGGSSIPPAPIEPGDEPESYQIIQAFTANTVWAVPETKWYRIIVTGTSGNGGYGTGQPTPASAGRYGKGGAGGNAGGLASSALLLEKDTQIQITITSTLTSFGEYMSASYGGKGGDGYGPGDSRQPGQPSSIIGEAFGGNKENVNGPKGQPGTNNGGDGGAYTSTNAFTQRYFAPPEYVKGGYKQGGDDPAVAIAGASAYPWTDLFVKISGGGGGAVGGYNSSSGSDMSPGQPGTGQPGVVIIEKAV